MMSTSNEQKRLRFWLENVFKKKGFDELDLNFPIYDTSGGYSADIIFVSVKAQKNNVEQIFEVMIKKSKDKDQVLNESDLKLVYSTESTIYSKIVPYFKTFVEDRKGSPFENIPYCFDTVCDGKDYVLFLENLKPKGFRINNLERLMDLDQAKLVLAAYGKWHAINIACKDQEPAKFAHFQDLMSPKKATSICELFITTMVKEMESTIDLFSTNGCTEIVEKLKKLKEKYPMMYRDCFLNKDETYTVVRHADCWNNNYIFHYDNDGVKPDKVMILDWQLSFIGSPLADVTQFIFYSCHQETIKHTDDLLQFYYNTLSTKLKELGSDPEKCLPWNVCQKSFKRYAPLAVGGVPLNIRFRHKTDFEEAIDIEKDSNNDGSFNVLCGNKIRDPKEYLETMKGILELCIERNFI